MADQEETQEESTPNNDFRFSKEDFIETQMKMNDATMHQGNCSAAWTDIRELKSKIVERSNIHDGICKWTVVDSVDEDIFKSVREEEETIYNTKHVNVIDQDNIFSKDNYCKLVLFIFVCCF